MMTREQAIELKAAVGRLMYSNNVDARDVGKAVFLTPRRSRSGSEREEG